MCQLEQLLWSDVWVALANTVMHQSKGTVGCHGLDAEGSRFLSAGAPTPYALMMFLG